LREVPRATAVNILIDPAALPAFHTRLKDLPRVASFISLTEVRRSFAETIRENVVISTTVYLTMALLITVGVAYNGARVQLSERARELASMRILGFTRAEVSYVLLGETGVLALAAQPVGWALGAAICWLTVRGFESDLYRLPFVFTPEMCARASLIALGATLAAALVVRRRLDRADLVAVMKTRE
jgi:putative ABC transport system permease protein